MLRGENVMPQVAARFYKAVVQAVLLYGSKTWNLSASALARLEGFHICMAYRLVWAKKVSLAAICLVAGSASFWDMNQLMYQCIVFQFLCIMIYLYEYILNSYFQSLAALVLGYQSNNVSMYR